MKPVAFDCAVSLYMEHLGMSEGDAKFRVWSDGPILTTYKYLHFRSFGRLGSAGYKSPEWDEVKKAFDESTENLNNYLHHGKNTLQIQP